MTVPISVSPAVAAAVGEGSWAPVIESRETAVWRVTGAHGDVRYVKVGVSGRPGPVPALADEHARLAWLAGRADLPWQVPSVRAYDSGEGGTTAALVTDAVPGEPDLRFLPDVDAAVALLGVTLARLHDLPADDVAFDAGPDAQLARVHDHLRSGSIDLDALPAGYHRIAPERLVELTTQMHPGPVPAVDRVLLHGDLCVTNLLVDPATGGAIGLVDWRWAGVGDRHLDLAVTSRSVVRNFGAEHLPNFFEAYGMPHPDPLRLEFYGVLEELS